MSACPKCGRGVEGSWSVCMACGTPLQAAATAPAAAPPPQGSVAGAAAAPIGAPVSGVGGPAAPPPVGVFAASPPPPAPGDFEIPRYQGGTAPAAKPGFKPWILIVILLVVVAAAGIIYFVWEKDDGGSKGAAPQGAVDRAKAGVQQMGEELKDELKGEWRELDRDPEEKAPAP